MKNENCGQRGKSAKKPSTFHEMFVISSKKNATNQSIKKEITSDFSPKPSEWPVLRHLIVNHVSSQNHSRYQPIKAASVEETRGIRATSTMTS